MNQDLNSLFSKNFNVYDAALKNDEKLLASRCNNLFAISSKYQAIYFESLEEIIITDIFHPESKIHFSCEDLRCFTFIDDDHIFGFFKTNYFVFDISSEEFQTKEEKSLSISKITLLPSNNSENISLLILDDISSKLILLELIDGNTYNFTDLFSNVIDFSITSTHVFVLYEKEAKLYEVINNDPNEVLAISINFPFPSHVQCTSTLYLIYFSNGYCIYDESGFRLNKDINEGKYICSTNCASVQVRGKVLLFCDEGKQEIMFDPIQCVAVFGKSVYYAKDAYNIMTEPLKIITDSQHYYFAISYLTELTPKQINDVFRSAFSNNVPQISIFPQEGKKICLLDFNKQIELSDLKSNQINDLFNGKNDDIEIKSLQPQKIDSPYLYFIYDDKLHIDEIKSSINRINNNASIKLQDRLYMISMKSNHICARMATFLQFLYPKLELYNHIENIHILTLVFPKNCNLPKNKLIKKTFQFDSAIQSTIQNRQILKFNSLEGYEDALNTKIMQYDKKEGEVVPLVDYETYFKMDNWKLSIRKLNKNVTKMDIFNNFRRFGLIYSIEMNESDITIQFVHEDSAKRALGMNGATILKSTIMISYTRQKTVISIGERQKNKNQKRKKKGNQNNYQNVQSRNKNDKQKQQNNQKQNSQKNSRNQQNNQKQIQQQQQNNQVEQNNQQQNSQVEQNNQQNNQSQQQNSQVEQSNQQNSQNQQNNQNQQNQQNQQQQNNRKQNQQQNRFRYIPPSQRQDDSQSQNQPNQQQQDQYNQQNQKQQQNPQNNQQNQKQQQNPQNKRNQNQQKQQNSQQQYQQGQKQQQQNQQKQQNNQQSQKQQQQNQQSQKQQQQNQQSQKQQQQNQQNQKQQQNQQKQQNNQQSQKQQQQQNQQKQQNNQQNQQHNQQNQNQQSNNQRKKKNKKRGDKFNYSPENNDNDNDNNNNNIIAEQSSNASIPENDSQGQFYDQDINGEQYDTEYKKPEEAVVEFNNGVNIPMANPFQDENAYMPPPYPPQQPVTVQRTSSIPKVDLPQKKKLEIQKKPSIEIQKKNPIEIQKKIPSEISNKNVVFIFNHIRVSEEEIKAKYGSAIEHEIIDPPNPVLDDRPIIKLTFKDEVTKNQFIRNNNTTSKSIRIFIANSPTLNDAFGLLAKERKSVEPYMVRLSGIPPGTTRSEVVDTLSKYYRNPFEYLELVNCDDDGSLFCDVAVKRKNDFTRLLKAISNVTINNIEVTGDGYTQWLQDHNQKS